ncbi:MAG: family 78 glycoside hydrolase catalytic domain [Saprospiraceae bacterium]|nr:family 78 glycoside hydrolase catalytic domain [Saprospiraceae bacterium]
MTVSNLKFLPKKNNTYFIDFGKHAFANLEFQYATKKSDSITIRLGEQLENGQINRKPTGTIRYQEIRLAVEPNKNALCLKT